MLLDGSSAGRIMPQRTIAARMASPADRIGFNRTPAKRPSPE
jgi:hypothetical protein